MPSRHFINTAEPSKLSGDMEALCGFIVKDAVFAEPPLDTDSKKLVINPLLDCMKCVRKGFPEKYLSRIIPGEKANKYRHDEEA